MDALVEDRFIEAAMIEATWKSERRAGDALDAVLRAQKEQCRARSGQSQRAAAILPAMGAATQQAFHCAWSTVKT